MRLPSIIFFFEVHQPYRLNKALHSKLLEKAFRGRIDINDIEEAIFDNELNKYVLNRVADRCYIPATKIIIENIEMFKNTNKPFKVTYSISGVLLEQALKWRRDIIDVFRKAVDTGMVELVEQTYYHSIVAFMPNYGFDELREQILEHKKIVKELFDYEPVSIENTEFTYNNDIACFLNSLGYKAMLTEGVDWVLGWRSPNYVYKARDCDIRVLTRNYRLSDDIGFRFSDKRWDQYPLTADKYASWLASTPGDLVFIAIDYETFGEHHWPETGIYEFLRWLPREISRHGNLDFTTPREAISRYPPRDIYDVPSWSTISWADERDISAWLGNELQWEAFKIISELRPYVKAVDNIDIIKLWKKLTISDHYYYMATKFGSIGEVHAYFSPYKNAAIAHGLLMESLGLLISIIAEEIRRNPNKILSKLELPWNKAFYFYLPTGEFTGISARSIPEFLLSLEKAPLESILFHLNRGDFENWIRNVFFLDQVADEIMKIRTEAEAIESKLEKLKKIISMLVTY
ncbi:MAG: glycoside hydrolase family 57 protein [Desulfurococcaceae archaeon]